MATAVTPTEGIPPQLLKEEAEAEAQFREATTSAATGEENTLTEQLEALGDGEEETLTGEVALTTPDQGEEYVALQHKHDVLRGKYEAELPRMRQQLAAKEEEVQRLKQQRVETRDPSTSETQSIDLGLTDEQKSYGEELWQGVDKVIAHRTETENAKIRRELNDLRTQQDQTNQRSFYERLDSAVPDWESINKTSEWKAWLNQHDVAAGMTRQDMLEDSLAKGQSDRAALLFTQFSQKNGATTHRPTSVASQVYPASAATPSGTRAKPKTITYDEYERGMDRVARMVAADPGSTAKADALEKRLDTALNEGRVIFPS